jgi:hypothetical protein
MDGVSTNAFGCLGLTPLNTTLGIFNTATRMAREAWGTLYFHPNNEAESSLHVHKTKVLHNIQNLHGGMDACICPILTHHQSGWSSLRQPQRYGGQTHKVNLKFVFTFMVGDTEMHDKLCGKVGFPMA